jgi:hypothetical protein
LLSLDSSGPITGRVTSRNRLAVPVTSSSRSGSHTPSAVSSDRSDALPINQPGPMSLGLRNPPQSPGQQEIFGTGTAISAQSLQPDTPSSKFGLPYDSPNALPSPSSDDPSACRDWWNELMNTPDDVDAGDGAFGIQQLPARSLTSHGEPSTMASSSREPTDADYTSYLPEDPQAWEKDWDEYSHLREE